MTTTPSQQLPIGKVPHGRPPAVECWSVLPHTVQFSDPKISTVLSDTPHYVILKRDTAAIVHATIFIQIKINRHAAKTLIRDAFLKWAWNITPDSDLKKEPSLTLEERRLWHQFVDRGGAELPPVSQIAAAGRERGNEDVPDASEGREKRARVTEVEELGVLERCAALEDQVEKVKQAAEQQTQAHRRELGAATQAIARLEKTVTELQARMQERDKQQTDTAAHRTSQTTTDIQFVPSTEHDKAIKELSAKLETRFLQCWTIANSHSNLSFFLLAKLMLDVEDPIAGSDDPYKNARTMLDLFVRTKVAIRKNGGFEAECLVKEIGELEGPTEGMREALGWVKNMFLGRGRKSKQVVEVIALD